MTAAEAEGRVRQAALRALGSRRRWRLAAVIGWSSFLGAIPILLAWLSTVRQSDSLSLGDLSVMFFAGWLCAMVPSLITALLAGPPSAAPLTTIRHGR
jgi:hypothetical protein